MSTWNIKPAYKPLSNHMKQILMDCHENEILNLEPIPIATSRAHGLLARKLIEVRPYVSKSGRQLMGLYLTPLGREYLNKLK